MLEANEGLENIFENAVKEAEKRKHEYVTIEHVLLALIKERLFIPYIVVLVAELVIIHMTSDLPVAIGNWIIKIFQFHGDLWMVHVGQTFKWKKPTISYLI